MFSTLKAANNGEIFLHEVVVQVFNRQWVLQENTNWIIACKAKLSLNATTSDPVTYSREEVSIEQTRIVLQNP